MSTQNEVTLFADAWKYHKENCYFLISKSLFEVPEGFLTATEIYSC